MHIMQFVVFGIKNDGNHRQSATTVNFIKRMRVTLYISYTRNARARHNIIYSILFAFRYLLALSFNMFKTTLPFYICLQTFVAQKMSEWHQS